MRALLFFTLFVLVAAVPQPGPREEFLRAPSWITYGDAGAIVRTDDASAFSGANHRVLPHIERQLAAGHIHVAGHQELVDTSTTVDTAPTESVPLADPPSGGSTWDVTTANVPFGLDISDAIAKTVSVMERAWNFPRTVTMRVAFATLGGRDVLANGGGTFFVRLNDIFDEYLPIAAAEVLRGADLNPAEGSVGQYDILITMNDRADWYVGVDGKPPPEKYDLVTVLLHEVYHNLMFAGGVTVDVRVNSSISDGFTQTGRLEREVPTRFDVFLANKDNCQVLGYLEENELAGQLNKPTSALLADSVTNDELYFAYQDFAPVAKLYAPRVFKPKSSVYHFDPESVSGPDLLMAPTIRRGSAIQTIGVRILSMQRVFLDRDVSGANTGCKRPLLNPTPLQRPSPDDRIGPSTHSDPDTTTADPVVTPAPRILGMRRWLFALVLTLCILGGLLLCALLAFLLYSCTKKKGGSQYATSEGPRTYSGDVPSVGSAEYEGEEGEAFGSQQASEMGLSGSRESGGIASGTGSAMEGSLTEGSGLGTEGAAAAGVGAGALGAGALLGAGKGMGEAEGEDGDSTSVGKGKNGSGGKGAGGAIGFNGDGGSIDGPGGADIGGGRGMKSVCPSSGMDSINCRCPYCDYHNGGRGKMAPSTAPRTFDPSSVPSPSSTRKAGKRVDVCGKPTGMKRSKSGRGHSRHPDSEHGSGSSESRSASHTKSSKRSKTPDSHRRKPAASVCPSTVPGSSDIFDCAVPPKCASTEPDLDDDTVFDCDVRSRKDAMKLGMSSKPIPALGARSKSKLLYLDGSNATSDSLHLRPYERASSQNKKPVNAVVRSSSKKKLKRIPSTYADSTEYTDDSSDGPRTKVPSTKVPELKGRKRATTKASSVYTSSSICTCSECVRLDVGKSTMHSCDLDSTISRSCCKHPDCKTMTRGTSTCVLSCCMEPAKKSCDVKSEKSSCKKSEKSSCKRSTSKSENKECEKENNDSNGKKSKSSCKKSSSCKSIERASSCKKSSHKDSSHKKSSSKGKDSGKKSSSHKSPSCKRSTSKESIKSSKHHKPRSCKKPPYSCAPSSTEVTSLTPTSESASAKTPPSFAPSDSHSSESVSKHPSSCPPSSTTEWEDVKPAPKSCAPSSSKKTATRMPPNKSGIYKYRRKSDDILKSDRIMSDLSDSIGSREGSPKKVSKRKHSKKPVATKVTTRHTTTKYKDGKPSERHVEMKHTSRKYRAQTEDSSDPTGYTSSYFMSEDEPTLTHDKSYKSSKHHKSHKSAHSETSRHISRHHDDRKHRHKSRHNHEHRDDMRRSRSEKDITPSHSRNELSRSKSYADLKSSKSHRRREDPTTMTSVATKNYVSTLAPTTMATRITDIHTVALDPEIERKSSDRPSHRTKSPHRSKSAHRSKSRERSPHRHHRSKSPHGDRHPYEKEATTMVTKRVSTTKVKSQHAPEGSKVTTTKQSRSYKREGGDSQFTDPTTLSSSYDYDTISTSDDVTSSRRSSDVAPKRAAVPSTTVPRAPAAKKSRSRSSSRSRIQYTSMASSGVKHPSSCPPSSETASDTIRHPSSCPPSSTANGESEPVAHSSSKHSKSSRPMETVTVTKTSKKTVTNKICGVPSTKTTSKAPSSAKHARSTKSSNCRDTYVTPSARTPSSGGRTEDDDDETHEVILKRCGSSKKKVHCNGSGTKIEVSVYCGK